MTDYVKTADYAAKDALATGDMAKVVRGTELGADFDAIAVAIATKYDSTDLNVTLQQYSAETVVLASGTPMLFYQNTAPTGWTKVTTSALDNCALRIVSDGSASGGNGGVTGGSSTFAAIFNGTWSGNNYTLTVTDIPSHNHGGVTGGQSATHNHSTQDANSGFAAVTIGASDPNTRMESRLGGTSGNASGDHTHAVSAQGGGGAHAHGNTLNVRYASFIVATKD